MITRSCTYVNLARSHICLGGMYAIYYAHNLVNRPHTTTGPRQCWLWSAVSICGVGHRATCTLRSAGLHGLVPHRSNSGLASFRSPPKPFVTTSCARSPIIAPASARKSPGAHGRPRGPKLRCDLYKPPLFTVPSSFTPATDIDPPTTRIAVR